MRTFNREETLVRRAKKGDRQAFGQLVRMYQDHILYLVYDFTGDYEQAQDIAQEVFLKAFNGIKSFGQRSSFETWLNRIAINSAIDAMRKKQRRPDTRPLEKEPKDPEDQEYSKEVRDMVEETFHSLSSNQKTAVIFRYFQGKTINDIANIMNISENTVRIHIHRAMEKIRQRLRE